MDKLDTILEIIAYCVVSAGLIAILITALSEAAETTGEHYAEAIESNAQHKQDGEVAIMFVDGKVPMEEVSEAPINNPEPVYIYVPREEQYYIDLELLAHLIYSEVGDDGEEAMYYAGSVVLNRIRNHEYPDDLYSVIYQKGQYEVTWNGGLYKEEPSDIAYEVAADLLEEGSILPEGVIYQAEFKQGSGTFDIIGNTYFCYQ